MIRKKIPLFLFLFSVYLIANSQPYGNEWINYSQKYYKFKIIKEGIYRIDSTALADSGIPIETIDPRNIQLFGRGTEQYIYIEGESDGVFNGSDFIEFFAQNNDGYLDSSLYINTAFSPNPYVSLFNDTATYFLTWNSSNSNKRITIEGDVNFGSYTPVDYFFKEEVYKFPNVYYEGETDAAGGTDVQYTKAEGYFDQAITLGSNKIYALNTSNVYSSGPDAYFKTAVVGASNINTLYPDHHLKIEYSNFSSSYIQLTDTFFDGYELNKFTYSISASQLGNNTNLKFSSLPESNYVSNRTAVSYIYSKYPHTLNLEGKTFFKLILPDNTLQTKSFLDISNFNAASGIVRFYDLTNHKKIDIVQNGSNYNVLVPNAGGEKLCFITSDGQIANITSIQPVTTSGIFNDFLTTAPDSAYIIITHKNLWEEANNYKDYRSSIAGGSHEVIVADVDELYDQFAHGINKHPLSIRNFSDFALDSFPTPPQYLFLLGKSIHAKNYKTSGLLYANTLVPSMGNLSSDNLFTAGINTSTSPLEPQIPTGRLAAKTNVDVAIYLNKVKEYEGNIPADWMKQVLHFGGGTDAVEQQAFVIYLNTYRNIIEDTSFGGNVHTFLKTSSAPIQITISDSVKNLIDNGVSIMTFFGHASGSSFDISIDSPSNYNNKGKYPLIIANSCYIGDIHQLNEQSSSTNSEDFIFVQDKGAIAFLASVGHGFPVYLNFYTEKLYKNIAARHYGESIGKNMQRTVKEIQGTANNAYIKSVCLEMTLHGDPAIVINSHQLPDYYVVNNSLTFSPAKITSALDSFNATVLVTNIGKAIKNNVAVELKRIFPDGTYKVYNKTLSNLYYNSTCVFRLPVEIQGAGLNKFEVRVDPFGEIPELSEMNNNIILPSVDLLILSDDIVPIYPYNYSIYPHDTLILKASTGDPFAGSKTYVFEIDTGYTFNSPLKKSQTVISTGGVIEAPISNWLPSSFILADSMVYYWRVKLISSDTIDKWKNSSFQYLKNKRGWEQAHFYQFNHNTYSYLSQDSVQRKYDFISTGKTLKCETFGQILSNIDISELYATGYKLDLAVQDYAGCSYNPAIHVAVIDPISLTSWGTHWIDKSQNPFIHYNVNHSFGNHNDTTNCRNAIEKIFIFQTNNINQMQGMKKMIEDSIPNGYYILAYTWIKGNFQSWADPSAIDVFVALGADSISDIPDDRPYIFFTKKGDLASTIEVIGDSANADISLTTVLTNNANFGTITSELIGPALQWDSLSWRHHSLESVSTDSVKLNIIGVDKNGIETIIQNNISSSNMYLNFINSTSYPYLKLNFYVKDSILQTCAQLDKWQVFYQPVPEAVINPNLYFSFLNNDTIQEGDSLKIAYAINNVSEYDFTDSLLVTYWIEDQNRLKHTLPDKLKIPPFSGESIIIDTVSQNTLGYAGENVLWIEVNPKNHINSQLEQYHFNNIARINFFTKKDDQNPLLDVTFDGQHILNGDIVSAQPTILVQLKDENKFLALNDTSAFAIYLKKPNIPVDQRIYFGQDMSFIPAALLSNSCQINYKPTLLQDGIYQLTVQAKDKSNNLSGAYDYKITFEVINKSTITEVLNYPNPFTTATRFVFTLTGTQVPDYFKIQIMTVTGKVVKEISKEELGDIHIGKNITEYAWNGTDEFGDRLANGVYLYRVITQLSGSAIEKRETIADEYFKKGFGKMYLMR